MFIRYAFSDFSPKEQETLARVVLDEIQLQTWLTAVWTEILQEEVLLNLQ
jgi:hypothetical protein